MEEFKIDKGVEMKVFKSHGKWPFDEMEVGDSFFLEGDKPLSVHACANGRGFKVAYRKVEEDGKKGYRVWRLA